MLAASQGCVQLVEFLIGCEVKEKEKEKAEVDACYFLWGTPLESAITADSFQIFDVLLKNGASPKIDKNVLATAAKLHDTSYLLRLLEGGANANTFKGLRPVELAALSNKVAGVVALFPHTTRIPFYETWTVDAILRQSRNRLTAVLTELSAKYERAINRKRYFKAIDICCEVLQTTDALESQQYTWLKKRSNCFALMGNGMLALRDAEACARVYPNSHEAHYLIVNAYLAFQEDYRFVAQKMHLIAFLLGMHDAEQQEDWIAYIEEHGDAWQKRLI